MLPVDHAILSLLPPLPSLPSLPMPPMPPKGARRVVGVAGNSSLRVVVKLDVFSDDGRAKPGRIDRSPSLHERLQQVFHEADLPICLAHHLPAIRIEDVGEGQRVFVEVLVLDGAPLADKIARLRDLLRPLRMSVPIG